MERCTKAPLLGGQLQWAMAPCPQDHLPTVGYPRNMGFRFKGVLDLGLWLFKDSSINFYYFKMNL